MPPSLSRLRRRRAFDKAVQETARVLKTTAPPRMPWSSPTDTTALVQRATQSLSAQFGRPPAEVEIALAAQGLTWGPPFAPGRPLDPFFGYRTPPWTWDRPIGINVQVTPRWGRISFQTLKAIIEAYDIASICVRHLTNDVRSLSYAIVPEPGVREDLSDEVDKARRFMAYPDGRQSFRAWLAEWLADILRYDAGTLYKRRNEADEVIALEVVSGATIIPLVDYYGRLPTTEDDAERSPEDPEPFEGDVVPAYLQIVEGMPANWLTADDLIYQPWFPQPDSNYGMAPMEIVLLNANTDLRFQKHFLDYFTEGTLPSGFMQAPEDYSTPAQVEDFQKTWDALMLGDQEMLRRIRWVPHGSVFQAARNADFDSAFPLYLMRRTCAAYGITPNDLGFTETVNRATGTTQVDVQFRVGTLPLVRHVEDIVNNFLRFDLGLRVRLQFDVGQEKEDRLQIAQAHQVYCDMGAESPTEARQSELGLPVDVRSLTPRYINTRYGLVPLSVLIAAGGVIDAETAAPVPGSVTPVPVDSEFVGFHPLGRPPKGQTTPTAPDPFADAVETGSGTAAQVPKGAQGNTVSRNQESADRVVKELLEEAADLMAEAERVLKTGVAAGPTGTVTEGITAATGIQGNPLEDAEDDADAASADVVKALRQWRDNARTRVKRGQAPRRFDDLPFAVVGPIWEHLAKARTLDAVEEAFRKSTARDERGRFSTRRRVAARERDALGQPRPFGGLALRATDTGRVLMLQRAHTDDDPAAGYWEFPGGHAEPGESNRNAAVREWEEETGSALPASASPVAEWEGSNGLYRGHVYEVPREDDVDLRDRSEVEDPDNPDQDYFEACAWWSPEHIASNPGIRAELRTDAVLVQRAVGMHAVVKAGGDGPKDPGPGASGNRPSSPTGVLVSS